MYVMNPMFLYECTCQDVHRTLYIVFQLLPAAPDRPSFAPDAQFLFAE